LRCAIVRSQQKWHKKFKNLIPNYNYKFKSQKLIEFKIEYYEKLNEKLREIEAKKPIFGENEDLITTKLLLNLCLNLK